MKKIQVLVGMIASGKSTYCTNAARRGALIMNDDAIVKMLHGDDYLLYDKYLKIIYKSIENTVVTLGLCSLKTVLIDRGLSVSHKGRQRWIALARSYDVPCEAIVFPKDTPDVHAMRRFKSDSRGHPVGYWLNVANEHNKIYSEPTLEEGFDKIHHINFEDIKCGLVI
jgi:predicted kinase